MAEPQTDSTSPDTAVPSWYTAGLTTALGDGVDAQAKKASSVVPTSPDADPEKIAKAEQGLLKTQQAKVGAEGYMLAEQQRKSTEYDRRQEQLLKQEGAELSAMKPWNAAQEMEQHKTSLWEQFGSPGFIVAMLGSAFTAMPMNSALQAGAAAMNAINQGNMNAYNKAFEAWKDNTDLVIKRVNMEQQEFSNIDHLRSSNTQEWSARMRALMARFDDQRGLALMENGMFPELDQVREATAKSAQTIKTVQQSLLEQNLLINALNGDPDYNSGDPQKMMAAYNKQVAALEQAKRAGMHANLFSKGSPEMAVSISKAIENGDQPPILTGLYGMSPSVRANLEQDGFPLAQAQMEWIRAQRQISSLNGPQMQRFIGLAGSVNNTIDEVRDLSRQMNLSGMTGANYLYLQSLIKNAGNTKEGKLAASYMTAINTLKEEFASLAQGGYAPHESAWALAEQQINGNYGVEELDASLTEVRKLINYRLMGIPGMEKVGPGAPNRYTGQQGGSAAPEGGAKPDSSAGWSIQEVQ